jgi:hypothetical protein
VPAAGVEEERTWGRDTVHGKNLHGPVFALDALSVAVVVLWYVQAQDGLLP